MAAITATVDLTSTPPRVSVDLSAWSADGPVTVQRVHADTSVHEIYMPDVSGGVSQVYDYWPPADRAFTYQAMDGSTLVQSASVTVDDDRAWIIAPGLPDTAATVTPMRVPDVHEGRPVAVMDSPFREFPAGEYGAAQAARFALDVLTRSADEGTALRELLRSSGRVLVRWPRTDIPWQWCVVPSFPRKAVIRQRRSATASAGGVADWRTFTLDCITVDDPDAAPFGDPTASYQALVDSGMTYQQLLDWQGVGATTYLDVIKGGF